MSLKHANSAALVVWTTGAGIVIGTNIDISTVFISGVATTVTIVNTVGTQFVLQQCLDIYPPIAINGPCTATSSGGSFAVGYVPR